MAERSPSPAERRVQLQCQLGLPQNIDPDEWEQHRRRKAPSPTAPPRERLEYWWDELHDYMLITHGPAAPCRGGVCRRALNQLAVALVDAGLAERVSSLSDPLGIAGRAAAIDLLKRLVEIRANHPEYIEVDAKLNELRARVIDGRTEADHVARCALADELRRTVLAAPAASPPLGTPSMPQREEGVPQLRTKPKKRGRRQEAERDPNRVAAENKLYRDWETSGLSQSEFLRERGIDEKQGKRILDRSRPGKRK